MTKQKKRVIIIIAAAVILAIAAVVFFVVKSNLKVGYRSISISDIFGKVTAQNSGKSYDAYKNMRLSDGYALITDLDSYTRMILDDDKYVKLEQNSHALFEALGDAKLHKTSIRLERGALTTEITKPLTESESYVVNTPNAVLAVRGTMFRVEVKQEENGDYYCDVYTYGGTIVAQRVMPDGTLVDEHVEIPAGYKATIKMDEVITVYLEEKIDEIKDDIDPIEMSKILDGDLVDVYNASKYGHTMYVDTLDFLKEIDRRGIDVSQYKSVYDDTPVGRIDDTDNVSSDVESVSSDYESGTADNSSENSEPVNIPDDSGNNGGDDKNNDDNDGNNNNESINESGNNGGNDESNSDNESNSGNDGTNDSSIQAHIHDIEELRTEPTCTEKGYVIKKCRICGEIISRETLQPQGHISDTKTVEPTCTKDGSETIKCKICGGILGNKTLPKLGHKEVTERTEPTCTEDGAEVTICERCNEELNREILPKLGHTETTETVKPTCTEKGKITVKCTVCGEIISETEIAPKGHVGKTTIIEATCTNDGIEETCCEICNALLGSKSIPATGHTEIEEKVEPTCTEKGKTTVTCSVCHEKLSETETDALGHDYVEEIIKYATCTAEGEKHNICSRCDVEEPGSVEVIAKTAHTPGESETIDGVETVKCSVCGEILTQKLNGITYPVEISSAFTDTDFADEVKKNDADGDGKLSLDEARAVTSLDLTDVPVTSLSGIETLPELSALKYTVHIEDGELTLPAVEGISAADISNVTGGTYDDTTHNLTEITGGEDVEYTYYNRGQSVTVTLAADENSTFAAETSDVILYTEDGSIIITETGYKQGIATEETPYTGEYIISQKDSLTQIGGFIWIKDGKHSITFDGINIFGNDDADGESVIVVDGSVTLYGSKRKSNIEAKANVYGAINISDSGELVIENGNYSFVGTEISYGIWGKSMVVNGGKIYSEAIDYYATTIDHLQINGGSMISNGSYDLELYRADTSLKINGGSLKLTNDRISGMGKITNGIDELECVVFDTFPSEMERTFTNSDGSTYVYQLTEADCADDGKYYIWKPIVSETPEITYPIAIDETNFPDAKFRKYVSTNFDKDKDGKLSQEECDAVTEINVSGTFSTDGGITSLKGVDNFTKLKGLSCEYNSGLTELDISKNTALTYLYCFDTQITKLDVSNNTTLTYLHCANTKISALDVRNNTALTILKCRSTQITSLDVSKNTVLKELYCGNTKITLLDISKNTKLSTLYVEKTLIDKLDVSKNPYLVSLNCTLNTNLSTLIIGDNTKLQHLECWETKISSLDVRNNTTLSDLRCSYTQIPFVDISNCPNLTTFSASGNKFYVSKNRTSIDTASDEDFVSIGFNFRNVYDVVGADYSRESGIFDNFTSDTVTYTYDCDGKRGHDETFTMVRTDDESLLSTANATRSAPKKLALDPSIYAGAMLLTLRKLKNKNNT